MSNEPNQAPDGQKLSDTEARTLLARATEIEAADAGLTIADLREVAGEAGIARHAFDRAVVELRTPDSAALETSRSGHTLHRRLGRALLDAAKITGVVLVVLFVLSMLVDLFG